MALVAKFLADQVRYNHKIYLKNLGTSNFVNRKRAVTVIESAEIENER